MKKQVCPPKDNASLDHLGVIEALVILSQQIIHASDCAEIEKIGTLFTKRDEVLKQSNLLDWQALSPEQRKVLQSKIKHLNLLEPEIMQRLILLRNALEQQMREIQGTRKVLNHYHMAQAEQSQYSKNA